MSDFDDDLVRTAFHRFEHEARHHLPQPDRMGVRTIARRHRTQRAVTIALSIALLLALPVAAFAVMRNDGMAAPYQPAESPSATPSPSASASASASPSVSAGPALPDGKFTKEQLAQATIDMPEWGPGALDGSCPKGRVRIADHKDGSVQFRPAVDIVSVKYVDVDGNGNSETVAHLLCRYQGGDSQVIVVNRAADGKPNVLGQVVATGDGVPQKVVFAVRAEAPNLIGVELGDMYLCCGADETLAARQWRTYGWTGTRFVQVDGPTSFPSKPANRRS